MLATFLKQKKDYYTAVWYTIVSFKLAVKWHFRTQIIISLAQSHREKYNDNLTT